MFQEIIGYCVISVHMNNSRLLPWINLLNDLRGWSFTTSMYHKQACYNHPDQLWLSEQIPAEADHW